MIDFDPGDPDGLAYFYVVTSGFRFVGTFRAVTSVVEQDTYRCEV